MLPGKRRWFYAIERQTNMMVRVHRFSRQYQRDLFVVLAPASDERVITLGHHPVVRRARSYARLGASEWPVQVILREDDVL